jgi:CTP:phosphocholine cytidylyltransferase-like protein
MKEDLNKQISQGKKAQLMLDEPLMKEAFNYLKSRYQEEIFNTSYSDHNQRQVLWMAYNMIEKIKGHLESVMTSGSLAQKELDQLQDLTK